MRFQDLFKLGTVSIPDECKNNFQNFLNIDEDNFFRKFWFLYKIVLDNPNISKAGDIKPENKILAANLVGKSIDPSFCDTLIDKFFPLYFQGIYNSEEIKNKKDFWSEFVDFYKFFPFFKGKIPDELSDYILEYKRRENNLIEISQDDYDIIKINQPITIYRGSNHLLFRVLIDEKEKYSLVDIGLESDTDVYTPFLNQARLTIIYKTLNEKYKNPKFLFVYSYQISKTGNILRISTLEQWEKLCKKLGLQEYKDPFLDFSDVVKKINISNKYIGMYFDFNKKLILSNSYQKTLENVKISIFKKGELERFTGNTNYFGEYYKVENKTLKIYLNSSRFVYESFRLYIDSTFSRDFFINFLRSLLLLDCAKPTDTIAGASYKNFFSKAQPYYSELENSLIGRILFLKINREKFTDKSITLLHCFYPKTQNISEKTYNYFKNFSFQKNIVININVQENRKTMTEEIRGKQRKTIVGQKQPIPTINKKVEQKVIVEPDYEEIEDKKQPIPTINKKVEQKYIQDVSDSKLVKQSCLNYILPIYWGLCNLAPEYWLELPYNISLSCSNPEYVMNYKDKIDCDYKNPKEFLDQLKIRISKKYTRTKSSSETYFDIKKATNIHDFLLVDSDIIDSDYLIFLREPGATFLPDAIATLNNDIELYLYCIVFKDDDKYTAIFKKNNWYYIDITKNWIINLGSSEMPTSLNINKDNFVVKKNLNFSQSAVIIYKKEVDRKNISREAVVVDTKPVEASSKQLPVSKPVEASSKQLPVTVPVEASSKQLPVTKPVEASSKQLPPDTKQSSVTLPAVSSMRTKIYSKKSSPDDLFCYNYMFPLHQIINKENMTKIINGYITKNINIPACDLPKQSMDIDMAEYISLNKISVIIDPKYAVLESDKEFSDVTYRNIPDFKEEFPINNYFLQVGQSFWNKEKNKDSFIYTTGNAVITQRNLTTDGKVLIVKIVNKLNNHSTNMFEIFKHQKSRYSLLGVIFNKNSTYSTLFKVLGDKRLSSANWLYFDSSKSRLIESLGGQFSIIENKFRYVPPASKNAYVKNRDITDRDIEFLIYKRI